MDRREEEEEEDLVFLQSDFETELDGDWEAVRCGVVGSVDENTIERSREGGVLIVEDGAGEDVREDVSEPGSGVADDSVFSDIPPGEMAGGETTIILRALLSLFLDERDCFFLDADARGLFPSSDCSTAGLPQVDTFVGGRW